MKTAIFVWSLVGAIALSGVARAQSLADLSRREQERRKAIRAPCKVYTEDDLRRYPVTTPATPAPDVNQGAAAGGAEEGAKPATAGGQGTPADELTVEKGEAFWRKLITDARSQLERSKSYLEALESRVATLTTEFYAREDPEQRSAIWSQRMKVLDDIERLKKDMTDQESAIAKIEADAGRAHVPPGWIR
jgi:hypothetical protein